VMSVNPYGLPWSIGEAESRRLRKLVSICLLAILAFGLIIPMLPLPEVEREALEELPPQLARIVLEKPEPIIPPPPKVEPKKEPEQKTVEPDPKVEPKVEPKPEPVPTVADAREKAEISGLLQFKDAFADARDVIDGEIERTTGVPAGVSRLLRPGFALVAGLFYSLDFHAIQPERAVPTIAPRPILFIHGSKDQVIPVEHSRRLIVASNNPANELWILPGMGHTEGVRLLGEPCKEREPSPFREEYLKKVTEFFDRWLG
ncbi:MAG: alpha/beta hydrolase, partial [SAR324 cluster bacterium]|nr:alpha/beta hydrolase [SAR324 cluster bacterium]